MNERRLLNRVADEIAQELWLGDDFIIREVRDADDLADARERLLSIRRDVDAALRILHTAERPFTHNRTR